MEKKSESKEKKNPEPKTVISNNSFTGVRWDAQAIEAINIVAQALLNLTELFKAQNIEIKAMLQITGDDININAERRKEIL